MSLPLNVRPAAEADIQAVYFAASDRKKSGIMDFIWFILIGILAGWLAGQLMGSGGFGLLGDLVLGVIGALVGGYLFGLLGISAGGVLGAIITATVGAMVLIGLLRVIKRA